MDPLGGQAVIEGIMMRNKRKITVAVRKEDKIVYRDDETFNLPKFFRLPFIRGGISLIDMLYVGTKALIWSANQTTEEQEKLTPLHITLTLMTSFGLAIVLFVGIPFFMTSFFQLGTGWFELVEGLLRMAIFFGYVGAISFMDDVKRLFAYHGAEHKAIHCYEAKKELTVENARNCSRLHPRCGTSFLIIVLVVSIVFFSLVSFEVWYLKLAARIFLLPVIGGVSYEILRLGWKFPRSFVLRLFVYPGLLTQKITTREPDDAQLEVGLAALKRALEKG